jgi:hypothetical protein
MYDMIWYLLGPNVAERFKDDLQMVLGQPRLFHPTHDTGLFRTIDQASPSLNVIFNVLTPVDTLRSDCTFECAKLVLPWVTRRFTVRRFKPKSFISFINHL